MSMDWTAIITSIITTFLGGGIGVLFTLKSARQKATYEALQAKEKAQQEQSETRKSLDGVWLSRLDQMREEIDYERKRNIDLDTQHKMEIDYERARNKELIQRNDDKERRFQDQTNRLREVQDRELKANEKILALTRAVAERDLELAHKRCEITDCPWRKPPTAATPPIPNGATKDEWHTKRKTKEKDNEDTD